MTNHIVCMRWGKVYTDEHVQKLYDKIKKNCSVPFEFYLFDNVDEPRWNEAQKLHFRGLDDPDQRAQGAWSDYERDDCGGMTHYRKLLMFKLDTEIRAFDTGSRIFKDDDTILYLDLDTVINGDLAWFFDQDMSKPWIVKSYWFDRGDGGEWKRQYHLRRCPLFNSSVLLWKPGQNRRIFDFIDENLNKVFFTYGVNDNFMFHFFGPWTEDEGRREHFQHFPLGIITTEEYPEYGKGIIHMLNGLDINKKNELCLS